MTEEIRDLASLEEELERIKVPKNYYRIGGYREEALCIVFEDNVWIVFEGERGKRYNPHSFSLESDACTYFWNKIQMFI